MNTKCQECGMSNTLKKVRDGHRCINCKAEFSITKLDKTPVIDQINVLLIESASSLAQGMGKVEEANRLLVKLANESSN